MTRPFNGDWGRLAVEAQYDSNKLASLRNVTVRQLQRIFRHEFDRTPRDWLNEQRILAAQESLLAGDPIKKVAFDLGFKQISHFCRKFKVTSGVTPNQFRKSTASMANVANG